ncbi:MAG: hypothetical protein KBB86_00870 [Candidatus Pacebacteria bacterium]|nr:hypothetical protein [Candidatus Paceibacterota bacterium]
MKSISKLLLATFVAILIIVLVAQFNYYAIGYYVKINAIIASVFIVVWALLSDSYRGHTEVGHEGMVVSVIEMKTGWLILFLATLGVCIPIGLLIRWYYSYGILSFPESNSATWKKSQKKLYMFFNNNIVNVRCLPDTD